MPRRNPFDDIDRLFDRLNRQFEEASERLENEQGAFGGFAVDVEETDEEFVVTVDLPGFEKEDVDVRVQDQTLAIDAEHTEAREAGEEDGQYIRRERSSRSFSRRLNLPEPIDETDVSATMKNGVLTVTLSKSEESGGHTIEVE